MSGLLPGTESLETKMKLLLAPILAATLAITASTAYAGGPVIITEEPEVVAAEPASSVGILPLVLVGIALCVALCGGSDDDGRRESDSDTDPKVR
jgi:hypothetical protein